MQYKTGTASIVNGTNIAIGDGTAWLTNVKDGDLWLFPADEVTYQVSGVVDDTHLTLSTPYAGMTKTAAVYAVSRDFTSLYSLPYPQSGDIGTGLLFKRAMMMLDTLINNTVKGAPAIISATVTVPPATPTAGQMWLIPAGATGAWASSVNLIAQWQFSGWVFYIPNPGNHVWISDQAVEYIWNGVSWAASAAGLSIVSTSVVAAQAAATTATTEAGIATAGANTATAQAVIATTGATTSNGNAAAVAALLASFRGVFLGAFASDTAAAAFATAQSITLTSGIMYENTAEGKFRQYNGSAWGDYDASAQASQSAAALSAATAGTQAGIATTQASNALASATNAAASAVTAQGAVGGVLVDASDTTAGKLAAKLVAGSNVTLTVQNSGANESLKISAVNVPVGQTVQGYAGNPNGHVPGVAAVAGASAGDIVWDTVHFQYWICTATGTAATAVWQVLGGMAPVSLASAATTDLGTAASTTITITGTTPITSLGTSAPSGVIYTVYFAASLTLTYNVASLQLPGKANITTQAGDTAQFIQLSPGVWVCIDYQTASGLSVASKRTRTILPSGSGTYYPPTGCKAILAKAAAGGQGGEGGQGGAAPATAGNTTFVGGSVNIIAYGGGMGTTTGGTGDINLAGQPGWAQTIVPTATPLPGGEGGSGPFGNGGRGNGNAPGSNGQGYGSGGAGGGTTSSGTQGGYGGQAGGYVEQLITSLSASYTYAIGAGTAGTPGGTSGYSGGTGTGGEIIIDEFY